MTDGAGDPPRPEGALPGGANAEDAARAPAAPPAAQPGPGAAPAPAPSSPSSEPPASAHPPAVSVSAPAGAETVAQSSAATVQPAAAPRIVDADGAATQRTTDAALIGAKAKAEASTPASAPSASGVVPMDADDATMPDADDPPPTHMDADEPPQKEKESSLEPPDPPRRPPGRPPGSKSTKGPRDDGALAAALGASEVDASVASEIPEDVLAEALGVSQGAGGRRSGRKTKARVIMIDGEPVLRSNAYTMEGGEPSVFDKELGGGGEEEDGGAGGRTRYNFEPAKRKYTKSGKPRKPYVRKQKNEEEAACGKHNREIAREIEVAQGKRACYLARHAKALAPFVDAKVLDRIKDAAERDAGSVESKVLAPVDNQPESIKAVLREYQLEGIRWMVRMYDDGCSCILADEMGLGKTLQSISFLACLKETRGAKGPHLVICPLSVLSSWMDELQKWCPDFRVVRLHSTDEAERTRLRREVVMNVASYDVAVTTYEMACNPAFNLTLSQKVYWRTMILDEGHKVKNEDTAAHGVLSRVHRQHTLLLTGTPVQNNLHELYAILAFLHPDVFTNASSFDDAFDLGTKEHKVDSGQLDHAHYLMKPFVLRRVKGEVEVSLPEKTETKIMCPLSPAQTFWYRRLLMRESGTLTAAEAAAMRKHSGGGDDGASGGDKSGEDAIDRDEEGEKKANSEAAGSNRKLQSLLMQLRKCCNHPFLFAGTDVPEEGVPVEELVEASGKLAVLDRILKRLKDRGHRVVLFSQFTSMLDILQDFLTLRGYQYARLDGSTNRVQRSIDIAAFNRPGSPMFAFLLSTRAGGLGVNLQTADTCVLFDSDWNPQVDTQAMARVHRIGQKKPVHVYRLVTAGTVEERMQQRAEKKLFLEQMVSRGSTKQSEALEGVDKNDLYGMLRFGVDAIFSKEAGEPPSDADLDVLMDRGPEGARRRSELASLQSEVQHTVADFAEGKASAAPISTYLMPEQMRTGDASGEGGETDERRRKKAESLRDIAAEFNAQILTGKRERKKTTMEIDGHTVLKANNYSLEEGESSVFAREVKQKKQEGKKQRAQVAGRDYGHSYTCQACWDGGDIVCCDLCPVSVHAECIGVTQDEIAKATRWACPHHSCAECGRKAAAVGGMLFRCEACPRAFCEDHLPAAAEIIGQCKRFQALGQRHPAQACFIRCDVECIKWAAEKRLEEGGDEAEEAQGWTIGAKVALTDAWIEERDHEIELPVDPGGGRSKPLAHATFTDLVHFLLRVEGPKRKEGRGRKKKDADKKDADAGPSGGWEDELEAADPSPGDEVAVRGGHRAYYTKGWEKLDEVAIQRGIDPKDMFAWNKPGLPGLTQRAYLIENTRLWLTPPPADRGGGEGVGRAEDPEAERRREEEELAAARAAAQHAGIASAKARGGQGDQEDEYRDEPMVLGRPLKGLRQKDIDPNEREAIMTEMFKRVRPHLELNIEKAKAKAEKRREEASREDEERRKQDAVRAQRLMRRAEGIPVHLLEGGDVPEDVEVAMADALVRALVRDGATEPEGEWKTCAELKVLIARLFGNASAGGKNVVAHMRTRWAHPEYGEALGFVLAMCAADRDERVALRRHPKRPEAIDLASVRATEKGRRSVAEDAAEKEEAGEKREADAKEADETAGGTTEKGEGGEVPSAGPSAGGSTPSPFLGDVVPPRRAKVRCGEVEGRLVPGGKRGEESVELLEGGSVSGKIVPATEFERLGGRGSTRKWRQSLRYVDEASDEAPTPVGKWLRETGAGWRDAIVGRAVEVETEGAYVPHDVTGFKPESGEHEVMNADGAKEWIYLFLQGTRWPDGAPETLALPPKPTPGAESPGSGGGGNKSGGKSGGGSGSKSSRGSRFDPSAMARPEAPEPTVASGPPPGEQVIEAGLRAYYATEGETPDALAACLKIDFRDVLAWNRPSVPGLTRRAKLRAGTRVWIEAPPANPPPPKRGDGGGLAEPPGARARAIREEKALEAAREAEALAAKEAAEAKAREEAEAAEAERLENERKRKLEEGGEDAGEGGEGDAPKPPPKKKRKKPPKVNAAKPKMGDHEEDVAQEREATCVIRAADAAVYVDVPGRGRAYARLAPGSVAGAIEVMVEAPPEKASADLLPKEEVMTEAKEEAKDATTMEAKEEAKEEAKDAAMTEAGALPGSALSPKPGALPGSSPSPKPSPPPAPAPRLVAVSVERFMADAGCTSEQLADWKSSLLFAGDDAGGEGQPVGGWAMRRGAAWGRLCVGTSLEMLRPDSARHWRSSSDPAAIEAGTSWRPGEVVGYDKDTGEHEVAFHDDGSEARCWLFLQTMRWLPTKFSPISGAVPEPPGPEGGIAYAMPPIPVACGGMRGCLLPGGKRGEELVRYAAPRSPSTPGVMAEFTVPATEFERLGGKGTAKKWRQSLRLVAPGTHRQGDTMGRWFRAFGAQTGDPSVGRHIEIFWPGDGAFYGGTICAYKPETGEHEVMYDDGGKETLQLSMQTVRWGPPPVPGARERIEKEAAAYNAQQAIANKKKKGGGGGGGGMNAHGGGGARGGGAARGGDNEAEATEEWIACDACGKWRKVPEAVVRALGDDDKWQCHQNPNPKFKSCDVPEEKWEEK